MSKQGLGYLANIGPITYYFEMFQYVQCVGMLIINFSQIACVIKKLSIKELLLKNMWLAIGIKRSRVLSWKKNLLLIITF